MGSKESLGGIAVGLNENRRGSGGGLEGVWKGLEGSGGAQEESTKAPNSTRELQRMSGSGVRPSLLLRNVT
eukprot:1161204-Prorocentrum_minimum.AAC.2